MIDRMRKSAPLPPGYEPASLNLTTMPDLLRDWPPCRGWLLGTLEDAKEDFRARNAAAALLFSAADVDSQREIMGAMASWASEETLEAKADSYRRRLRADIIMACICSDLPDTECLTLLLKLAKPDLLREIFASAIAVPDEEAREFALDDAARASWERRLARSKSLLKLLPEPKSSGHEGKTKDVRKAP